MKSDQIVSIYQNLKIYLFLSTILFVASCSESKEANIKQPNIIIIHVDDLGWADLSVQGSTFYETPHIDGLASNGVRFTDAYASASVCSPTRAALMTGRYPARVGITDWIRAEFQGGIVPEDGQNPSGYAGGANQPLLTPRNPLWMEHEEVTIADILKEAGYKNVHIGKWHLGGENWYPETQGFHMNIGGADLGEPPSFFDPYYSNTVGYIPTLEPRDEGEYLTDREAWEAVNFIEQYHDRPFFMHFANYAVHTPIQATEKYLSRFDHIDDEKRRTYAAMISAVDDGVGDLYETLDRHGLTENPLIFFLSDNGGPTFDNASDNSPLRGFKGDFYEGGVRVPYAVSWPAVLPKNLDYDKPVSSLDIFATSVAHAGAEPSNKPDGVDLVPFLTGENSDQPHKALFWRNSDRDWIAMATHNYKYLNLTENSVELFNLTKDIAEEYNISIEKFEKFQEYVALPEEWESGLISPVYLGLLQNNQYNQENPDRFQMTSIYEPDTSPPSVPEGYELVWSDEFNSDGVPDERWWNFEHGFVRNNELQWYQPGNARIEDGRLIFKGKRARIENSNYDSETSDWRKNREYAEYTSASINTRDKFSFQYGIMEVRARVDTTLGAWPAIWTLGNDRQWPERGEVDVMEFYRIADEPTILANAAWLGDSQWDVVWDSEKIPLSDYLEKIPDWPERFHTWKMNWSEEYIKLYLNDELLNKVEIENATYDDGFNPFRQPHYILLNLAIGSNGGNPEKSEFPISYEVDFVRVYQEKKAETN